ncbi:unnamed protein product [Mortierella alpina]
MIMKTREILTKYSSRLFEEDERRRDKILLRIRSLRNKNAGLVFWKDFCKKNKWPRKPTNANIKRYIQEFVDVQKDRLREFYQDEGLSKCYKEYSTSYDLFLAPVWRYHAKRSSTPSRAVELEMEASVPSTPSTSLNGHHHIVEISQVSASVVNGTTNLNENTNTNNNNKKKSKDKSKHNKKRSRNELESDGEHSAEGSTQVSLAVFVPSKAVRSSRERLTSPPVRAVSPRRLETIVSAILPAHAHDTTGSSVAHSPEASGPVGMVLTVGDANDKYPQFRAQEFNTGLSRQRAYGKPLPGTHKLCPAKKPKPISEVTVETVPEVTVETVPEVTVETVPEVLQEWRYGLREGQEAIQVLNNKYAASWRSTPDTTNYQARLGVVAEYIRLVLVEGYSNTEAIETLEAKRRGLSIAVLKKALRDEAKLRAEAKSSIYGMDEPEYPRHLIHLPGRAVRPPRTELTGFPLPVRRIISIENIWKEWEEGWEGQPSIKSLIAQNSRLWYHPKMKVYGNHFRFRNQLVRTIYEAVRRKVVPNSQVAIELLEGQRGAMEPSNFCRHEKFKSLVGKTWGISTKVPEWWECGQYDEHYDTDRIR